MSFSICIKHPDSLNYQIIDKKSSNWIIFKDNINDWINHKLKQENWTSYILYNDEIDSTVSTNSTNQSKGILLWNENSISWLIHSIPKWPLKLFDNIPKCEYKYVHTLIFMTFHIDNLSNIIDQIKLMQSNIYETSNYNYIPRKRAPALDKCVKIIELGKNMYHIAKHNKISKNLFKDIIIETYGNKDNKEYVYLCKSRTDYTTKNDKNIVDDIVDDIENIDIIYLNKVIIPKTFNSKISKFALHQPILNNEIVLNIIDETIAVDNIIDKSKWAISSSIENPWVCISDLNNRLIDNTKSGGGIVIVDRDIWRLMMNLYYCSSDIL